MRSLLVIPLVLLMVNLPASSQEPDKPIPSETLHSVQNRPWSLSEAKDEVEGSSTCITPLASAPKEGEGGRGAPEMVTVRGDSLAPLINPGETIKLVYGYYNSHPAEREDIIAYKYADNDAPIIKIVKAVPGDKWELRKSNGGYLIVVNDQPLKNSQGEFYQILESNVRMLKLYVKSYPVLPDNTYLILGNKVSGSLDATRFGLIDKSDIVGKVAK